ncbi:MAG: TraR/DksA family transcriptional regulator [Aestuariivirgaceae bacterium]
MAIDEKLARQRLNARKAELEELSQISSDDRATVTLDQQSVGRLSRMDALQQQAMAQAQERARAAELVRIDQALRRVEEGEYGYCQECGEEIAPKRLEIDPSASNCVKCAGG